MNLPDSSQATTCLRDSGGYAVVRTLIIVQSLKLLDVYSFAFRQLELSLVIPSL